MKSKIAGGKKGYLSVIKFIPALSAPTWALEFENWLI